MDHRPIPDLLIAVTDLHHDVGVVHADGDFELIAQVRPLRTWKLTITEPEGSVRADTLARSAGPLS